MSNDNSYIWQIETPYDRVGDTVTYDPRAQRIAGWARGNPQPPVRIERHRADRCNLRCRFCWQVLAENLDYSWEPPEMTYPVLERIKRHGVYNIITTNGTLWRDEHLRGLVEIGWDRIPLDIWYGDHLLEVRRQMLANQLGEHCLRCCPSDITQRRRWHGIFEDALENNDEVNVHTKR